MAAEHDHGHPDDHGYEHAHTHAQGNPHDHDHGHDHAHGHDHDHNHDHDHGHGHGHGHDHDHGHGLWGALKHALVPHSHDAADSIDSALESSARGIRAVKLSLVGLALTAVLQFLVVAVSGSVALLADTIHNLSDALTAVPLWIAFRLARRPANSRYTYGYGRAEDLAGLFVIAMIALSAVLAGWEAVDRLLNPAPVRNLLWVALAGVIGFLGNEAVAVFRIREGRAIGSAALVADGHHARIDGLTSLAVVVGAAGVAVGWTWADPVIGLVITVAILFILRTAGRDVLHRLMDAVEPGLVEQARVIAAEVPGVRDVQWLRMRWIGHNLHADTEVSVDAAASVGTAHEVAERVEHHLISGVPRLEAAVVRTRPDRP